ncbi:MAG: hypothetical protein JXA04_09820 [Gammaproteobacteria bacterium]|nr:hypothetical protein [Gammaproteobacteria bacterium]
MRAVIEVNPADSVIRVRFLEKFSMEDYRNFYRNLINREDFKSGNHMIWDIRALDISMMSAELIKEIGSISVLYAKQRGRGKTAFVVGSDFQFGTARMFDSSHIGLIPAIFRPFKTMEEAEKWVKDDNDMGYGD